MILFANFFHKIDIGGQVVGTIDSYTVKNGMPNNSIRDIVEDKLGNIWIGTAAGIVLFTDQRRKLL